MDDRKKLVELLSESGMVENKNRCNIAADHLIANGVTFATDNPVGDKLSATATHGDRIRSMDDIDLAEFLCSITDCFDGKCPAAEYCRSGHNGMKEYLHQRVEEE